MTRRSNITEELRISSVLAQYLVSHGYENYDCLRWRHKATRDRLTRNDLTAMAHALEPEAEAAYLKSERFFNHVAFAALALR